METVLMPAALRAETLPNPPLVSVIVPVYNTGPFLPRCIDSVLSQTYSHVELLLIDDGSTDGSGAVCDAYAESDPRVRVIHKANGGISHARNTGLDAAKGDFIAFSDHDDFYAPTFIGQLLALCLSYDCDIAHCRHASGSADRCPDARGDEPVRIYTNRQLLERFYTDASIYCWDKLYRRQIFDQVRFPNGTYTGEDLMIVHRTLFAAQRIAVTEARLYYHYTNPGSVMNRGFSLRWADGMQAYPDRIAFARANGLTRLADETLRRGVYKLGYLLRMNERFTADRTQRRAFRQKHRAMQLAWYREAMTLSTSTLRDKLFLTANVYCPFLYNLYNFLKWNLIRGRREIPWGGVA